MVSLNFNRRDLTVRVLLADYRDSFATGLPPPFCPPFPCAFCGEHRSGSGNDWPGPTSTAHPRFESELSARRATPRQNPAPSTPPAHTYRPYSAANQAKSALPLSRAESPLDALENQQTVPPE